jgi:hypothetical protein
LLPFYLAHKIEKKMGVNMEKRTSDRHNREARLVCAYFNTNKYCHAKMLYYGDDGLYFESEFAFKPKTTIYIRVEQLSQEASESPLQHGFRTVTLGEVKWCKEIPDPEFYRYGVGVSYYEPY